MNNKTTSWRWSALAYGCVAASWAGYVALSLATPSTAGETYNLSAWALVALEMTIFIPVLVIWLVALRGTEVFKRYALFIENSPEGRPLHHISNGLIWALAYLISITLLGAVMPYFAESPDRVGVVLVRNHAPAAISLVAFILLYRGARTLRQLVPGSIWTPSARLWLVGYGLFAAGFAALFLVTAPTMNSQGVPQYSLPKQWLVLTLVIPYLLAWFLGMLAAISLAQYARQVKGIIYRQALRSLSRGILAVIGFAIVLQVFTLLSRNLGELSLGAVLIIVYVLLVLYGLGFWLIRNGAKQLMRIEVVQ